MKKKVSQKRVHGKEERDGLAMSKRESERDGEQTMKNEEQENDKL